MGVLLPPLCYKPTPRLQAPRSSNPPCRSHLFLEVKRNRTGPFWPHPVLAPPHPPPSMATPAPLPPLSSFPNRTRDATLGHEESDPESTIITANLCLPLPKLQADLNQYHGSRIEYLPLSLQPLPILSPSPPSPSVTKPLARSLYISFRHLSSAGNLSSSLPWSNIPTAHLPSSPTSLVPENVVSPGDDIVFIVNILLNSLSDVSQE